MTSRPHPPVDLAAAWVACTKEHLFAGNDGRLGRGARCRCELPLPQSRGAAENSGRQIPRPHVSTTFIPKKPKRRGQQYMLSPRLSVSVVKAVAVPANPHIHDRASAAHPYAGTTS